jgi:hypothetical protein
LIKSCGVTGCHCVSNETLHDSVSRRSVASTAVSALATEVPEGALAAGPAHAAQAAAPAGGSAGAGAGGGALHAGAETDPSCTERLRSLKRLSLVSSEDTLCRLSLPVVAQSSVASASATAGPGTETLSVERRRALLLELLKDAAASP